MMVLDNFIDDIMISDNRCDYINLQYPYYCRNLTYTPFFSAPQVSHPKGVSGCIELNDGEKEVLMDEEIKEPLYKCSLYGNFKPLPLSNDTKKLTTDVFNNKIPDNYQDCFDPNKWGDIYSEKWNECQDFFDEYHRHNDLNTFIITNEGEIHSINKNTVLRDFKIQYSSPVTITNKSTKVVNSTLYHLIKKYNTFFKKNKLINKLNQ